MYGEAPCALPPASPSVSVLYYQHQEADTDQISPIIHRLIRDNSILTGQGNHSRPVRLFYVGASCLVTYFGSDSLQPHGL